MTTELLDLPEEETVIVDHPIVEYTNEDLRILDTLLADVSMRHSVYAHEILDNLPDNPYSSFVCEELVKLVSDVNGDRLLHTREFLNPLLDYRLYLTTEAPAEQTT